MAKRVHHEDAVEDEALNTLRDQVSSLSMTVASLLARVQDLEDTNSIRYLHHIYGYYIDKCNYPFVVDLVSQPFVAENNLLSQILTFSSFQTLLRLQFISSTASVRVKETPFIFLTASCPLPKRYSFI
jgi:hypothetical protein